MADDPRWGGSEPRLVELIRDEILAAPNGRITFARFMQRVLTEPDLGYYATSQLRPTREGDFLSAPELHPFFGRCLGRVVAAAAEASAASPFHVLEYGGGRGTLRADATVGLGLDVVWSRADLPDRSDDDGAPADLVIANEYLDALPVHRLVQGRRLEEAFVSWEDGWFRETLAEPSTAELAAHLAADQVDLRPGQRAEVCLEAPRWLGLVADRLAPGGVALVIDYGHDAAELYGPRRMAGTLLTYRGHAVGDDPFDAIGHSDLTAHVDVTALERAAEGAGLVLIGSTTQGSFLARLGLGHMLSELGRRPDTAPQAYLEARASVARLLDPRQLGGFRVLAWARPADDGSVPALPGFADTP
ncbi:MAG: SAM-dependent methyltransferase [Candidatus Limnocylindrales bacterium]